jgi:hypothetical protein
LSELVLCHNLNNSLELIYFSVQTPDRAENRTYERQVRRQNRGMRKRRQRENSSEQSGKNPLSPEDSFLYRLYGLRKKQEIELMEHLIEPVREAIPPK